MLSKKLLFLFVLFIPCVSHGATVVKTWNFASTTEGLADAGNSATLSFAAETSTGNPTNSVKFSYNTKNASATEYARNASTGETWETWGVPAGATVTSIQFTAWSEYTDPSTLGPTVNNFSARIIDSGGTSVTSGAGDPIPTTAMGTGDTAWNVQSAGSSRSVDAGKQASTTDVRLELQQDVTTSGPLGILLQEYDTFELTITYTSGAAGATKSRHRIITSQ